MNVLKEDIKNALKNNNRTEFNRLFTIWRKQYRKPDNSEELAELVSEFKKPTETVSKDNTILGNPEPLPF